MADALQGAIDLPSQCTFWCSVLSDCAPTITQHTNDRVSMHLLVLSAFRPWTHDMYNVPNKVSQCTFWCSVLSDQGR